jgi:sugar/nucleoside kinase (ribokinase family)
VSDLSSRGPTASVDARVRHPVVCAGIVVADHLCTPLDHMPTPGELIGCSHMVLNIGGGAANVSADLARLGLGVSIRARVGDDIFGRFMTESLEQSGVDTRPMIVDPGAMTSQTLIVNVRGQDRRFIHCSGANTRFTPADLDAILDPPPRVLYVGYFLLMPGLDAKGLAERFARARAAGTVTVLDVATDGPGNYIEPLKAVLPHTDVFLPNGDESTLILGESDPERQALAFHEMGAKRAVVTLGEHGAVSVSKDLRVRLGVYPTDYVDGSGGGDAFVAGYIAGLLEGLAEIDCLRLASAAGASCVRAVGTTAGVFNRAEAQAFIGANDLSVNPLD